MGQRTQTHTGADRGQTGETGPQQPTLTAEIDERIQSELQRLEQQNSYITGEVIDITTLTRDRPLADVEGVSEGTLTPPARGRLEHIVGSSQTRYDGKIAVWIRLHSQDVVFNVFNSTDDGEGPFPPISAFTKQYDIAVSGANADITGMTVPLVRTDRGWTIEWMQTDNYATVDKTADEPRPSSFATASLSEHATENTEGSERADSHVTRQTPIIPNAEALKPAVISVFAGLTFPLLALNGILGMGTATVLSISAVGAISILLVYLYGVTRLDHQMPAPIRWLYTDTVTDYPDPVTTDQLAADEYTTGEFVGLVSLADETASVQEVADNAVLIVNLRPDGQVVLPFPLPFVDWHDTSIKRLVYRIASSVDTLPQQRNAYIPLTVTADGTVEVDRKQLPATRKREASMFQLACDRVASLVNGILNVPTRTDRYH